MQELYEEDLIKLINRDKETFIKVYKMYSSKLVAFSLYYVKNIEDAKDVVEDVFCNFYKYLESYDYNKSHIFTYLCAICKNIAIDYIKKDSKIDLYEYDDRTHGTENKPSYMLLDLKELMNKEEYMIMCLKYLNGNTVKEISMKMNLSERTIYRKLNDIESIVTKYVKESCYE